ncbi:MAG TPA: rod shape-determining protein RodA [Candidatus Limnocylindria bacterium]|jgi:rod shape determining protein RodA|nr:rod shape-determining protein RodA [Candidatus Limnocylindria bacterium]
MNLSNATANVNAPIQRKEQSFEWPLWLAVLGLMLIGAAFIFSATGRLESARGAAWYDYTAVRQVMAYVAGLGCVFAMCLVDYGRVARWALIAYWASIIVLLAVFLFGADRHGARRWLDLGPIQFQPSEFAKLAFLFSMANFLSRPAGELHSPALFFKAIAMAALPFLLILKQPDLGSALVFMPVTLVMLYVAGAPMRMLRRFVLGAALAVILIVADVVFAPPGFRIVKLQDYQRERLLVYFNADFAPKNATPEERQKARLRQNDKSLNVRQALISIGSGGILGKGWRQGTQHALGYLPRLGAHNDFIFSVIAEEEGFVGSVFVLGLYAVVIFTGLKIAGQARDRLGRLLAVGVVTLLFTHVFVNIGMNIRLVPVTGIPLPLLSAGGTSVVCSLVAIGILQNVHLYRRHY